MEMLRSGSVMATDESRMFCERLAVELSVIPRLENVVFQLTDEVRVLCVMLCGLYRLLRLLRS